MVTDGHLKTSEHETWMSEDDMTQQTDACRYMSRFDQSAGTFMHQNT